MRLAAVILLAAHLSQAWPPEPMHAIYISVVEVSHEKQSRVATMKVKVFADDLEDAIRNAFDKKISLTGGPASEETKRLIQQYMTNHLVCTVGESRLQWQLMAIEPTGDAVRFSFQATCPMEWKEVRVFADLLTELFPTQSNVFSLEHEGDKRYFKLSRSQKEEFIKF